MLNASFKKNERRMTSQNIISIKNPYLRHLLAYRQWYLSVLVLLVLLYPLATSPLPKGPESYYHLTQAREVQADSFYYAPLTFLQDVLPLAWLNIIPLLLALTTVHLFLQTAIRLRMRPRTVFFFSLLLIISPTFIWVFSTISAYSYYLFLVLACFFLLTRKTQWCGYLSLLPLLLATFIDLFSTILLIIFILIYFTITPERKGLKYSALAIISISLFLNLFFLRQPLILGPFQDYGFVSDFGSRAGVSFFLLLLSLIGIATTWKRRYFAPLYLFFIPFIPAYLYNSQAIIFLALLVIFFTTQGLVQVFERRWVLGMLKKFTLFVIILGILFSTLSYLDRYAGNTPFRTDQEVLRWVKDDTPADAVVFSHPEDSYYVSYFAERQPSYVPHHRNAQEKEDALAIVNATYVEVLFPLLEKHNVSYLYLTPFLKKKLPQEYGLLFLLRNERFKLVYSQEGYEVWEFT